MEVGIYLTFAIKLKTGKILFAKPYYLTHSGTTIIYTRCKASLCGMHAGMRLMKMH